MLAVGVLLLVLAAAIASASQGAPATDGNSSRLGAIRSNVPMTGAVSPAQATSFGALRGPASLQHSDVLRRYGQGLQSVGGNVALARAVTPAGGESQSPWYLIPGTNGVCFFDGTAGECASDADARAGRLFMIKYEPSGDSPFPKVKPGEAMPSTVIGIAPDGVDTVSARDADGTPVIAPVMNNTYSIAGRGLTELALRRSDQASLKLVLPAGELAP
jgi:hypothetical protein